MQHQQALAQDDKSQLESVTEELAQVNKQLGLYQNLGYITNTQKSGLTSDQQKELTALKGKQSQLKARQKVLKEATSPTMWSSISSAMSYIGQCLTWKGSSNASVEDKYKASKKQLQRTQSN